MKDTDYQFLTWLNFGAIAVLLTMAFFQANEIAQLEDRVGSQHSTMYRLEESINKRLDVIEHTFHHLPLSDDLKRHLKDIHGVGK